LHLLGGVIPIFILTENKGIIISPKELCEVLEMEIEQEEYD
jgi:hypothetical protein